MAGGIKGIVPHNSPMHSVSDTVSFRLDEAISQNRSVLAGVDAWSIAMTPDVHRSICVAEAGWPPCQLFTLLQAVPLWPDHHTMPLSGGEAGAAMSGGTPP